MGHNVLSGTRDSQSTRETFLPPEKITAFDNLNRTLDDPFSGTGIQNIIQDLLRSLIPGEQAARQTQADQFRKAGAISDASRGVASSRLEEGFQRNRSTTAAEGFLKFLQPILQGRGTALTGIPALSKGQSTSSSRTFRPGAHGGSGSGRASLSRRRPGSIFKPRASGGHLQPFAEFANPTSGARGFDPSAIAFGPGAGTPEEFFERAPNDFVQNPSPEALSGGDGLVRGDDGSISGISPNIQQAQFDTFLNENFFSKRV